MLYQAFLWKLLNKKKKKKKTKKKKKSECHLLHLCLALRVRNSIKAQHNELRLHQNISCGCPYWSVPSICKASQMLSTLGKIFSRRLWNIFLIFPRKQDLRFHANYLHWNVKSCFLEKKYRFVVSWISPERTSRERLKTCRSTFGGHLTRLCNIPFTFPHNI